MNKVLVLGATGMLGREVCKVLNAGGFLVLETSRAGEDGRIPFEVGSQAITNLLELLEPGDFIVNALGVISHRISPDDPSSRLDAVLANAQMPLELAIAAQGLGLKVIQIATDCVYDGSSGGYSENDPHNPLDVYGKTKSLGEAASNSVMHLRCSIIGAEAGRNLSLFEWVRNQARNATVQGYTNHFWNGVTTTAFAQVVAGIVNKGIFSPGVQHLVPSTAVSKYDLVNEIVRRCQRTDLSVTPTVTEQPIDRTLTTLHPERNRALWQAAGYIEVPSVQRLVAEMPIN